MRRANRVSFLTVGLILAMAVPASAFSVSYTGSDPNYAVTEVTDNNVKEDYGAESKSTFNWKFGIGYMVMENAVVDLDTLGKPILFTTSMTFDDPNDLITNQFNITWEIENNSPFAWESYYFMFRNNIAIVDGSLVNHDGWRGKGQGSAPPDSMVGFHWSGGKYKDLLFPGETLQVGFSIYTTGFRVGKQITCEQVARASTALPPIPDAPVPGSLLLLSSGVLGLLGLKRKLWPASSYIPNVSRRAVVTSGTRADCILRAQHK